MLAENAFLLAIGLAIGGLAALALDTPVPGQRQGGDVLQPELLFPAGGGFGGRPGMCGTGHGCHFTGACCRLCGVNDRPGSGKFAADRHDEIVG